MILERFSPLLYIRLSPGRRITSYNVCYTKLLRLLTEQGHERAEDILTERGLLPEGTSLYEPANILLMHHP